MSRKPSFEDWIDEVGIVELARQLKVNPVTVRLWRKGHGYPRVDLMRKIKKLSHGEIGYEEMIDRPLRLTIRKVGRQ